MNRMNGHGQVLVESLGALVLLILFFFCIFYLFLIGIDKIRSLDTVYHLARVQEVHPNQGLTFQFMPVVLQCFGMRPYWTDIQAQESAGPAVSEVSFRFAHQFLPLVLPPHKSVMRVAQPNATFLTKSYPTAAEDPGSPSLLAEMGTVVLLAQGNQDSLVDAAEVADAFVQAARP